MFLGDLFAYFKDGDIYGSTEINEKPFICVYSIKDACITATTSEQ